LDICASGAQQKRCSWRARSCRLVRSFRFARGFSRRASFDAIGRDPRACWRGSIRSCCCWRSQLNAKIVGQSRYAAGVASSKAVDGVRGVAKARSFSA
jgi:hypothetical protein